ncbi:uncharacterized protein L3040_003371 [Drepanopeziza brunnea f. sp. 'multigermtubi']|uniref:uncharacterized protein n=1 Tax=Drepanopeziza brunnea f. sp. 'multigermtubi' TaxID=698441 RepID=UPI00238680B2|nr:hypothetical protein L3040_003371 [Drepanopeziza brunnea f. sp. 'multigermtubi']
MKTRGRSSTKTTAVESEPAESIAAKVQLGTESTNPPHLLVLPKNLSKDARIVTLENPRHFSHDRYVICPENGFYEFTKVATPKTTPRSWLLSPEAREDVKEKAGTEKEKEKESDKLNGYVMNTANLMVATQIDPLFMALSALSPLPTEKASGPAKKLFLSCYDYMEKMAKVSPHFASFSRVESIRAIVERRMASVCDTVEAGDEIMYRLSEEKLLGELLKKAKRMTERGLPASMEEKFVRKALDAPMLSMKRDASSLSGTAEEEEAATPGTQTTADTVDTADTADTATSSFSEASTAATSNLEHVPTIGAVEKQKELAMINAPDGVAELLRIRTALFFICSAYIAPHVTELLKRVLSSSTTSTIDFAPLDAHLAHLAKLRQDALASRSLGDFSRKRSMAAEDGETRAEKKRKQDEEDKKKKANQSRGVQQLKKVNTSGMKKMSDFFKKK